jgi:hypothetical protein
MFSYLVHSIQLLPVRSSTQGPHHHIGQKTATMIVICRHGNIGSYTPVARQRPRKQIFFFRFPNLFAICRDTFSKWCVGKRGRVEECSVALLCNKRVKTLCSCREKRVQTKEKYKLRLTTKNYKLSYDYLNYTINLVGRSFGKWRRRRLRSGCSRRVRRMSFGCAVRRTL